jgi:transposase-like protein
MVRRKPTPKVYTPAFKVEAVRLMHERLATGATFRRIAQELEINPDRLRVWSEALEAAPPGAKPEEVFPGSGNRRCLPELPPSRPIGGPLPLEEEVARLRRENERLRLERDFLKKAAAFFAKESQ